MQTEIYQLARLQLLLKRQVTEYLQNVVSSENYLRFQRRRADIEKQVSFLFIYPIVYVLIWTFPLIQQYYPANQPQINV